jgi:S-adenosylmethionine/arginine decarboxylase-like enzyme
MDWNGPKISFWSYLEDAEMTEQQRRRGSGSDEEFWQEQRVAARYGVGMKLDRATGDDEYAEQPEPAPFGYLLTLDLYGCNVTMLADLGRAYAFLETLVCNLGVEKQAPPFVFLSPPEYTDKVGITGWVPLIESGIQVHTLQPRHYVSVVIYCCRQINESRVEGVARAFFEPHAVECKQIAVGRRYRWQDGW